jgi:hypothetical protein
MAVRDRDSRPVLLFSSSRALDDCRKEHPDLQFLGVNDSQGFHVMQGGTP